MDIKKFLCLADGDRKRHINVFCLELNYEISKVREIAPSIPDDNNMSCEQLSGYFDTLKNKRLIRYKYYTRYSLSICYKNSCQ